MCSDATNGKYEGFKVSDEIGCSWEGEATTSESRLHLSDLLEMLIRLDQQGIFMKPVDDSIAPDYSKVIKNPMCFLRMREKIDAQQYPSWSSFLEDFERICYNAMKYNEKRSQIWNAANLMLRQGNRCLEQQFSRHTVILGLNKMHRGFKHEEKNVAEVKGGPAHGDGLAHKSAVVHVAAHETFVASVKETKDQIIANENSSAVEVNGLEPKVAICLPAKSSTEDKSIEILRPLPEEDCRFTFDEEATECSSSFSGTDSELEDESCSVDSELRDGNGANALTEDLFSTSKRKKRVLNADWKLCREGIEWQCRWLELRIQRLEAESNKYTKILEAAASSKDQRQQDGSVSRTSDMDVSTRRCRVFRRRRRRKVEECVDSMMHMFSHPVFSNYEKQPNQDMTSAEDGVRDERQQNLQFDNFDSEVENEYEDNIVLEKDSIEQYLWQIQALQMRISHIKDQLVSNSPVFEDLTAPIPQLEIPRTAAGLSARVHSPVGFGGRSVLRDLKGQGGASSSRRRNSDFDINNVIMPDPQLVNYVEPVRHVFIETPHWRLAAELAVQDEESSDEDTDEEVYKGRHALMQAQERQSQYSPVVFNRSRSLSATKERPRSNIARRGSVAKERTAEDFQTAIPTIFGNIPKGRRRNRERRNPHPAIADTNM